MRYWIRQLFRSTPTAPIVKPQRARLGLQRLEERETPAILFVNSTLDNTAADGFVTLREAILAANANTTTDLGQTGSGADTIVFINAAVGATINLTVRGGNRYGPNALEITSPITIQGSGETIQRDPAAVDMRLFYVGTANSILTLSNLTLTGGLAKGGNGGTNLGDDGGGGGGGMGAGGAIYNRGTLTINNCLFTANTAQGGNGGAGADNLGTDSGGGGGGGGLGGNGGNVTDSNNDGGGGGGGFFGNGGDGGTQGGGGGGGIDANGNPGSGTTGGLGGNNGGSGGSFQGNGIDGFFGGGGGGGSDEANGGDGGIGGGGGGGGENDNATLNTGGAGGFGGGGGGGGEDNTGGKGGYGAGGGGASNNSGAVVSGGGGGAFGGSGGSIAVTTRGSAGGGGGTGQGGAIFNQAGTVTIINSTFSGNATVGGTGGTSSGAASVGGNGSTLGGGIVNYDGTLTVHSSTFTENLSGLGNSIMLVADNANALITLHNSILGQASISGSDYRESSLGGTNISSGVGNLIRVNTGFDGTIVSNADPLLQPLANNGGFTRTHALGQNSPALTTGSATFPNYVPWDQRGTPRDAGIGIQANPDIGAYEVNHPLATVGAPTTLAGLFQPKPSASANEAFVKGLYQSTLLRAPDTAGLNGWLTLLNGGTSRSTVANGFVNSTENRRNQVTFFYRYFLSREPDTAGLNGWVSQLQSGTDEGTVMTGFILSNEFSGLNTNSQFVNLMYYALLSRQADAAGFNGWVNAVNGGMSRGTVVNAFLRSDEGLNRVVNSMFQTYLKRYGSTGDLGAFRSYLNTNTFGQAATLMLSSAEFFTNAGNNLI